MLQTTNLPRVFLFDNNGVELRLTDPSATMNADAVLHFYSNTYPLLTTAKIEGPEIKNDEVQYNFITTIGTKG
ncbi:MAG: PRTRC system protein C [Bacteroidetes bacterium]|nr:PRTRC system protein C [Bacteroidota bacterium]